MKTRIIFLIAVTILTCCNLDRKSTVKQDNLIEVDFKSLSPYGSDTSIFESIRYVPLETNEKSLIGGIGKILYSNGVFYLYDNQNQAIFLFDKTGNHIKNVGNLGRGPGEYISISSFDVDSDGNIYIWDGMSNKLIIFCNAGKYREYRLRKGFEEFFVTGNGYLIVRNLLDQGMIKSRIAVYDYINDETEELLDTGYYYDDYDITRFGFSFFKSDNRTFINARFQNEILEISDNGDIYTSIIINDPIPSIEFINNLKTEPNFLKMDQHIVNIGNIYENSKTISMTIMKGGLHLLLISKTSGNSIIFSSFPRDENYFGSWPIRGVCGEEFITIYYPHRRQNGEWKKAGRQSTIEDNPTLVLFKFKEF